MTELRKELAAALTSNAPLRDLSEHCPDFERAYDVQDAAAALAQSHGQAFCGRKTAWSTPAMQAPFGLKTAAVARVIGARPMASGTRLALSDYSGLAIEPEIVAVLGQDIPAGTHVDATSVVTFIDEFRPGFEILNRRNAAELPHAPSLTAYNILNAGCVLGDKGLHPKDFSAEGREAVFTQDGEELLRAVGTAPEPPAQAAAFIVNHFTGRGQSLKAGEVLLCGTHYPPLAVSKAGRFSFTLSGVGAVSLEISSA